MPGTRLNDHSNPPGALESRQKRYSCFTLSSGLITGRSNTFGIGHLLKTGLV
jgi:hypothetical protein